MVADQWIVDDGWQIGIHLPAIQTALDILGYRRRSDRLTLTRTLQWFGRRVASARNNARAEKMRHGNIK